MHRLLGLSTVFTHLNALVPRGDSILDMGNTDCLILAQHVCNREGMNVRVIYSVTLLAEAYCKEKN